MTDLTDQDRRDAREWATMTVETRAGFLHDRAAARVILATVDAPAPTPAEALRDMLEKRDAGEAVSFSGLLARVEQVQQERDEARAEVERLKREQDRLYAQVQGLTRLDGDRNSEMRMLTGERNEALIEVERLTAEVERLDGEVPQETPWQFIDDIRALLGKAPLNPADVKEEEPYHIYYGVYGNDHTIGVRIDGKWRCIGDDRGVHVTDDNIARLTRLVPAPRIITNPDELDALPDDTIVRIDEGGDAMRKYKGKWHPTSNECCYESRHICLPATVLWEPGA